MTTKCALITGITGQDGSYLAEWLLGQGYRVHGIVRRVALEDPDHRLSRLMEVRSRLVLHAASLESYASIHRVVHEVQPDECYHLAAQSFVSYSFDDEFSADPELYRPAGVNLLKGDAGKAQQVLGWTHRVKFDHPVREMVDKDCRALGVNR